MKPLTLIEDVQVGMRLTWKRRITEQDLLDTIRLTGDRGGYHVDPDFARRAGFRAVIAPGLLQASLVTKLGGDLNFLAREVTFRYLLPVYAGDDLEVQVEIVAVEREKNRIRFEGQITNQAGEVVLTSSAYGNLPKAAWGVPDKTLRT
jgi:acyl dehydratase